MRRHYVVPTQKPPFKNELKGSVTASGLCGVVRIKFTKYQRAALEKWNF